MKFVVLPGFDGSARLRSAFAAAFDSPDDMLAVEYPTDPALSYDGLCQTVQKHLPALDKFCIIAESFSGPIAIRIAAEGRENLAGLVFVASFAKAPSFLARLITPWAPVSFLRLQWASEFAARVLGGWSGDSAMLNDLAAVIRSLPDELMRRRMAEVASADCLKRFSELRLPCLYLLASQDMIVSRKACQIMRKAKPEMRTVSIPGPHFLLGARPKECAAAVQQFAKSL